MQNRWTDDDAQAFVGRYGPEHGEDLALRTYTSRLLGADPSLVLHGGGNTSVKRVATDLFGDEIEVIAVKASGYDLANVPPEAHVAVRLDHLRRLRHVPELSDEAIVNELRTHLLDAGAPTPSIETPVHALVPHRYVDHTHADAVLVLTNQTGGVDLARGDGSRRDRASLRVPRLRPGPRRGRRPRRPARCHRDGVGQPRHHDLG